MSRTKCSSARPSPDIGSCQKGLSNYGSLFALRSTEHRTSIFSGNDQKSSCNKCCICATLSNVRRERPITREAMKIQNSEVGQMPNGRIESPLESLVENSMAYSQAVSCTASCPLWDCTLLFALICVERRYNAVPRM